MLACYLFTCPSSTMTGLYYLPLPTLCHEAGFTEEEARATLGKLIDLGFVRYDYVREFVWVVEAARYQVAESLSGNDPRIKAVVRELHAAARRCTPRNAAEFYRKYKKCFSLPVMHFREVPRSHIQEQEKEQEQGNGYPPTPPAAQGGAAGNAGAGTTTAETTLRSERREARRRIDDLVEQARQFAIGIGQHPTRDHLRTIRGWIRAGHPLARVQQGIEAGEHLPRPRL